MRSDSYRDPENRAVAVSLSGTVENNGVDTASVKAALAGNTDGRLAEDYRGTRVLSAYTPLDVYDTTWAMLAEIDAEEAFAPIVEMQTQSEVARMAQLTSLVMIVGLTAIMVSIMALMIAMTISRPISTTNAALTAAADGDYTKKVEVQSHNEFGQLATATNRVIDKLVAASHEPANARTDESWPVEEPVEA